MFAEGREKIQFSLEIVVPHFFSGCSYIYVHIGNTDYTHWVKIKREKMCLIINNNETCASFLLFILFLSVYFLLSEFCLKIYDCLIVL